MSLKTTERCDCCGRDVTFVRGERIYRGRFRYWWHWLGREELRGEVTICDECWYAIGKAVRDAREAAA